MRLAILPVFGEFHARDPHPRLHGGAREARRDVRELTEANVDEALRDVRMSLLEADVDFTVVSDFLARVKQRALGEKVETRVRDAAGRMLRVTPGQHFVKICEEELIGADGARSSPRWRATPAASPR